MKNHSVQAMRDIDRVLKVGNFSTAPITQQVHCEVRAMLHQAVRFELPDDGIVIERAQSLAMINPSELRLPHPVVALEYECADKPLPADMIPAKKRIALCLDYEANEDTGLARLAANAVPQLKTVGGLIVIPCYFSERHNRWCVCIWGCVLPRGDFNGLTTVQYSENRMIVSSRLKLRAFHCLPEWCAMFIAQHGTVLAEECAMKDSFDEAMAAVSFITAQSGGNVYHPAA